MLESGIRPDEVYTTRPENVDLMLGRLLIPHGKTAAARWRINLAASAREVLRQRMGGLGTPYLSLCESDPAQAGSTAEKCPRPSCEGRRAAQARLYDLPPYAGHQNGHARH
jgi:integrase